MSRMALVPGRHFFFFMPWMFDLRHAFVGFSSTKSFLFVGTSLLLLYAGKPLGLAMFPVVLGLKVQCFPIVRERKDQELDPGARPSSFGRFLVNKSVEVVARVGENLGPRGAKDVESWTNTTGHKGNGSTNLAQFRSTEWDRDQIVPQMCLLEIWPWTPLGPAWKEPLGTWKRGSVGALQFSTRNPGESTLRS